MSKIRFAWVRVFSTDFQPAFIDSNFTIRHNITGYIFIREINVKHNDWIKKLI